MCLIAKIYKNKFLLRYDKDEAIPYFSAADFPGLACEEGAFLNSSGVEIRYFTYYYEGYDESRTVLFCHGIGPGHTAYLAEIETLCRAGYKVLTLDYTGCGASGGERLPSANAPTWDAMELIDLLKIKGEIIPVGHSLGGYTALNLAHLLPEITRAVIISGFVDIAAEIIGFLKLRALANAVKRYEKRLDPHLGALDNLGYIRTTTDKLLWFHSTDDPMVNYESNGGQAKRACNPNVRVVTVTSKKHNPQYTEEALKTMNEWMGGYYRLIEEKKLVSPEAKRAYFADKPVGKMTEQDPLIYAEIVRFISG